MNFSVIGGDLRLIKLSEMLSEDGNLVNVFGMEKSKEILENNKIKKLSSIDEAIDNSDIIISSIPFLKNEKEIYTVFSDETITLEDFFKASHNDKIFIAGNIKEKERNMLDKNFKNVIDIMQEEQLVVFNTIATAEGAIDVAIKNTDTILHGSNVLVLGYGRVGKVVADRFKGLNAKVTCAARKNKDLAWIEVLGFEAVNINDLSKNLEKYDIIINTVPHMIIDKSKMNFMKRNVLLIDLASAPGGINEKDASKLNLKLEKALALPGKIAPLSSAEFIKKTIYSYNSQIINNYACASD